MALLTLSWWLFCRWISALFSTRHICGIHLCNLLSEVSQVAWQCEWVLLILVSCQRLIDVIISTRRLSEDSVFGIGPKQQCTPASIGAPLHLFFCGYPIPAESNHNPWIVNDQNYWETSFLFGYFPPNQLADLMNVQTNVCFSVSKLQSFPLSNRNRVHRIQIFQKINSTVQQTIWEWIVFSCEWQETGIRRNRLSKLINIFKFHIPSFFDHY